MVQFDGGNMYIDSYQVEVQIRDCWHVNQRFRPQYKWKRVVHYLFGFWKQTRQEIAGDPLVLALIVKADAFRCAQGLARQLTQQLIEEKVRIARIEREGARLVKFVVWQNDKGWLE